MVARKTTKIREGGGKRVERGVGLGKDGVRRERRGSRSKNQITEKRALWRTPVNHSSSASVIPSREYFGPISPPPFPGIRSHTPRGRRCHFPCIMYSQEPALLCLNYLVMRVVILG